jgi:hypothetical protein
MNYQMKKAMLVVVILFLSATAVRAQAPTQAKDEWQLFKEAFKKDKKDLVNEYMKLSPDQASKFWPLYDEYNQARGAIGKDRLQIISDYTGQLSTLTDGQADDLARRLFKNDQSLLDLDKKYYSKISKSIGGVKAAQYLQMEQYFATNIKSTVQERIPFIGEIERASGH